MYKYSFPYDKRSSSLTPGIKIISGGQTGIDRAALDAAIELGFIHGGWCPMKRHAEDGRIPDRYNLKETSSKSYRERTELNVRDSDATLIITWGRPVGGTGYTLKKAKELNRPYFILDMERPSDIDAIANWVKKFSIKTLNIAGPRESFMPGDVYRAAKDFLRDFFAVLKNPHGTQ